MTVQSFECLRSDTNECVLSPLLTNRCRRPHSAYCLPYFGSTKMLRAQVRPGPSGPPCPLRFGQVLLVLPGESRSSRSKTRKRRLSAAFFLNLKRRISGISRKQDRTGLALAVCFGSDGYLPRKTRKLLRNMWGPSDPKSGWWEFKASSGSGLPRLLRLAAGR